MNTIAKLNSKEAKLIDNIINKLNIYMERNKQNLFSLANSFGFAYQPFYRLIKYRNLPTITSLAMISDNLNCTIEELISDDIFLDIDVVEQIDSLITPSNTSTTKETIRFHIPYEQYLPYISDKFFAIKLNENLPVKAEQYRIYILTDKINIDGNFIVEYQGQLIDLNVISISTKFVIAFIDDQEQRIPQDLLKPIAKLFDDAVVLNLNNPYIQGIK